MSTYLIADISVHDANRFREYAGQVPALIEKHQGRYLVRGGALELLEGDWQPDRLVVIQFPSIDQAKAFLEDPDYQPVAAIRHAAATTNLVLAEGYDG